MVKIVNVILWSSKISKSHKSFDLQKFLSFKRLLYMLCISVTQSVPFRHYNYFNDIGKLFVFLNKSFPLTFYITSNDAWELTTDYISC